ncbi:Hypothetical predicted protein [Marmota monax]|uniref:Uncharacterized protein n=1 Tax=Marmota monax TaxID=9995 RepID=A0A5E4ABK3_MARMO|nr:Hypothetical predicted protein [Marmota monax]
MAAGARPGAHPPWLLAMPTPVLGRLPTYLRRALQPFPKDSQKQGLWSVRTLGRTGSRKTKPREDSLGLPAAEGDLIADLGWPGPSQQLGFHGTIPHVVWSDGMEEPSPSMEACSLPLWAVSQEDRDGDSSVSSGRISGSSGGHESCATPRGPWRERPPQMLGPRRHPRKSNPRLEQLRDKIRAQTQWQASCASLGTSAPSSASRLYKAASLAPRSKTRKATSSLPAPTRCPGQWQVGWGREAGPEAVEARRQAGGEGARGRGTGVAHQGGVCHVPSAPRASRPQSHVEIGEGLLSWV